MPGSGSPCGLAKCVACRPSLAAVSFIRATKASTLPDTASARAMAASLPDWIIRPRRRSSTDTFEPGSRNIFELPAGTFQARVETVTSWVADSSFLLRASNTT
ncbi:hypothetical protein FQZ97_936780 [compost metagenome]